MIMMPRLYTRLNLLFNTNFIWTTTRSFRQLREPKPYRIITKDPPSPQPVNINPKSMSKVHPAMATFEDGTTVHLNMKPEIHFTSLDQLPPPSHRFLPVTPKLTQEQIKEVQTLRESDPKSWSVRRLAKKFNVSNLEISRAAPCPESHKAFLAKKEALRVSMLPIGSLMAMEKRKKLRELW